MHFGISEGKGGLKHGSRPWLGMDIFWNCPFVDFWTKIWSMFFGCYRLPPFSSLPKQLSKIYKR